MSTAATPATHRKIEVTDFRSWYGPKPVHHGISFHVEEHEILGVIGPAQSGKTTLLRAINRTLEFTAAARWEGSIKVDGEELLVLRESDVLAKVES